MSTDKTPEVEEWQPSFWVVFLAFAFLLALVGLTVWRLTVLQERIEEKERVLAAEPLECPEPPPPELLNDAFYAFTDHLYVGITIYQHHERTGDPLNDTVFYHANPTAKEMLPQLSAPNRALRGLTPRDLFPVLDNEDGRAYFDFVVRAIETRTTVTVGDTSFNGIRWYSAIVPVDEDKAAVVFHSIHNSTADRDRTQGLVFDTAEQVDAQVSYLDNLIERVEMRVESSENDRPTPMVPPVPLSDPPPQAEGHDHEH